jgi:hypothetical protein
VILIVSLDEAAPSLALKVIPEYIPAWKRFGVHDITPVRASNTAPGGKLVVE